MAFKGIMTLVLCGASAFSVAGYAQDAQTNCRAEGSKSSGMKGSASKDKMFLKKASEGGMAEVKLGELASQKASSPDVKSFGQKMVDDHTAINNQMKPIAERMGVTPPTSLSAKDEALYDRLNGMSGTDFDKAYVKAMVADHHEDLKEFTAEMTSTRDTELKAAVTQGRDVIRQHTTMADGLAKSHGAMRGMKHNAACNPAQ